MKRAIPFIISLLAVAAVAQHPSCLLDSTLQQYNSLAHQLEQADAAFFQTVQTSVSALLLQNAALDDSLWHTWCEKRYNEIALHWLVGTEPDSSAMNDLRLIAQTCLNDGGRAVLGARGLCEVWLKEHYGEEGCQAAPQGRSAKSETESEILSGLMVLPNPANDVVRLLVNAASMPGARQIQVLNLNGQLVHAGTMPFGATEWRISVHGWPEGMYVLRVINGTEAHSLTFLVQHR